MVTDLELSSLSACGHVKPSRVEATCQDGWLKPRLALRCPFTLRHDSIDEGVKWLFPGCIRLQHSREQRVPHPGGATKPALDLEFGGGP